jgi:hypothetical protein
LVFVPMREPTPVVAVALAALYPANLAVCL